jgi:drug/metabolite transporter (DMT)-like permease
VGLLALHPGALARRPGNWPSALALLAYALCFSAAYLRLGAATGALILFAAVQGSMLAWGFIRRDRPMAAELAGLAVAFAAFVWLLLPGLRAPDPMGSALMIASGIAWGVYSVRGRGVRDPLAETAGNFVRAALPCLPLLAAPLLGGHASAHGMALGVVSGVVTSGLGYAVWYRALPRLSTTQAGTVQLTVPAIAAAGAALLLGEALTARLVIAACCILGGVALAIMARRPAG